MSEYGLFNKNTIARKIYFVLPGKKEYDGNKYNCKIHDT